MSPSPAISFDVSTMMTRLFSSVESTRALSRKQRRLADSGTAEQQQALSGFDDVAQNVDGAVDGAADAARQTRQSLSRRLRMAEMRCSVRSMPARLSCVNDADAMSDVIDDLRA